eukprot:6193502-Pleurochrysis_carterae.AAC.1
MFAQCRLPICNLTTQLNAIEASSPSEGPGAICSPRHDTEAGISPKTARQPRTAGSASPVLGTHTSTPSAQVDMGFVLRPLKTFETENFR